MGNPTEEKDLKKPKTIKKMVIGTYILIITLNVNGLNAPTKRHRLAEWVQKQDLYICCLQETHFRPRDTFRLKVGRWKKIFHANGNQKKAGVAILISGRIDFKIMLQETRTLHNDQGINPRRRYNNYKYICTQRRAPQYIRQLLTAVKEEIDSNTVIVRDFNTSLTPMDRSSRQKINKETQALNDKTEEIDLIDIYDIPSKNSRLHFLLKYAWNILQDRSHLGSQIKPQ